MSKRNSIQIAELKADPKKALQFLEEYIIVPIERGAFQITFHISDDKAILKSTEQKIRKVSL